MLAVLVPFGIVTLAFDRRQRMHDFFSSRGAGSILALAGIRVEVRGLEHLAQAGRCIVVANHRSAIDTLVLLHVLQRRAPIRFVAKRSLFRLPVLGWGMRRFGHMPVDGKSIWNSLAGLRMVAATERGPSTVFFPEGTRSRDGVMLPFKPAAFKIAGRMGVPVLPITIAGSAEALPYGRMVFDAPATICVEIHAPIATRDVDPVEVAREARQRVEAGLASAAGGA
ncbi:MAG TPA: lysophospholipid acyltransferase family protein [Polyangiaceae bacterium]|jgi:1-acyl-sn-glycerol-3-phosphate acyltransferase